MGSNDERRKQTTRYAKAEIGSAELTCVRCPAERAHGRRPRRENEATHDHGCHHA